MFQRLLHWIKERTEEEENRPSTIPRDRIGCSHSSNMTNEIENRSSIDLQRDRDLSPPKEINNILERNLFNVILKYCDDWQNISEKLGFDKRCFYKKSRFVECLTWLFWKSVLQVYKNGNHDIITVIEASIYLNIEYSFWDLDIPQFSRKDKITDFPYEISEYIPRLKRFLRSFNIDTLKICEYDNSSSDDLSYRMMKVIGLDKIQSWSIWKRLLLSKLKFDGPQIVEDIENDYPYLKNTENVLSADELILLRNFLTHLEMEQVEKVVNIVSKYMQSSSMRNSNDKNLTTPSLCNMKDSSAALCKEAAEEICEDVLEAIADKIDDVSSLSSILGFEEDLFENPLHLIENVTWLLWKFILHEDSSLVSEIENYFPHLKNNTKEFADLPLSKFQEPSNKGIFKFIKNNLSEWKEFGKVMGVSVSKLEHLEDKYSNQTKDCVGALMRQHCYPFDPVESFKFWVKYLLKFENGREVVNMIFDKYPTLIHPKNLKHAGWFNENFSIAHHDERSNKDILKIEKYREILVPIAEEVKYYHCKEEFSKTIARYHHRYEMILNLTRFNFSRDENPCVLLHSIEEYLKDSKDSGFVYKGYSLTNHYHLLADGIIPVEKSNNNIIAYIANDGVILHIKFCKGNKDDEKVNSIMQLSREFVNDVRLAQNLHECVQNNPIVHVGVVVCDKSSFENEKLLCKGCIEKSLIIKKQNMSSKDSFSDWYEKTLKSNNSFKDFKALSKELSPNISKDLKQNIIIYMTLDHYHLLPSFTNVSHYQMNETKKLVYLTGCQMQIFYSPFKYKIIKGGYGSGKSTVLEKLFEATICNNAEDFFFYICYDPMSEFHLYLQSILKNLKQKNVLLCNIRELSKSATLNLSSILKQIKNSLKSCRCHFFIDDFNGSQLTREEVDSLSIVLQGFRDSHINIAVQPFEYIELDKNSHNSGFRYDYLSEKTDFQLFQLDYSLRCTKEITRFVNDTIRVIESSILRRPQNTHSFVSSDNKLIDQEMADDKTSTKFHIARKLNEHSVMFNQAKELGHNVSCNNVQMIEVEEKIEESFKAGSILDIENTMLFHAINHFLLNIWPNKVAIVAFDEVLYYSVNVILSELKKKFTCELIKFLESDSPYEVLLTDHATIRGFEFPRLIFVFGFGRVYMNYRLIECFTRATTNLYLVVNVEEQGMKENKVAQDLIKSWRKLSYVERIVQNLQIYSGSDQYESYSFESRNSSTDLCRDNSSSTGGDLKIEQNQYLHSIEVDKKSMRRYPWSNVYPVYHQIRGADTDEEHMMEFILKKDNDYLFQLFVLYNQINIPIYRRRSDSKSFLHIAAYHGALNICKLLVEIYQLKVNQSFNNEPTPLEDAIKYNRFEVTKYFLQHIERHELTKAYFEKLMKVAKNNGNIDIIKYLRTTYSKILNLCTSYT